MASKPKFGFSTSRILLLVVAAVISLSGRGVAKITSDEPRRCYWCGPLAEQVHRSRRASPCIERNDHITVCDSGLSHCAIVATSPPHTESRYCVKLYQDECYPLYCNSTRMWKMICPCRGDLCNGPITDREKEAFAVLTKLATKNNNKRIKKRMIVTPAKQRPQRHISNNTLNNNNIIENSTEVNESINFQSMVKNKFTDNINKSEVALLINAVIDEHDTNMIGLKDNEYNKSDNYNSIHKKVELDLKDIGNNTDRNNIMQSDEPSKLDKDFLPKMNTTGEISTGKEITPYTTILYTDTTIATINRNVKSLNLVPSEQPSQTTGLQQNENGASASNSTTTPELITIPGVTSNDVVTETTPKQSPNNKNDASHIYKNIFSLANWILLYHCF